MDQLNPFHKPNKKNEEWEDDGLDHSSNQTTYYFTIIWSMVRDLWLLALHLATDLIVSSLHYNI
jgi:hypothetical protein